MGILSEDVPYIKWREAINQYKEKYQIISGDDVKKESRNQRSF